MFYFSYIGNKRVEIKHYISKVEELITSNQINKVIEPFCGSSSTSYYLWKKYPHLEFHLNDIDPFLYEFLQEIKQHGCERVFNHINKLCIDLTKEKYNQICNNRKPKTMLDWCFCMKVSGYRLFLFPTRDKFGNYNPQKYKQLDAFFQSSNVHIYNKDYKEIFNEFKNDQNAFIFLDPPYFQSDNSYYSQYDAHKDAENNLIDNTNMYADIGDLLDTYIPKVMLVCNDIGIMRYAYKRHYKFSYEKLYQITKSKTKHAVFNNF